MLCGYCGSNLPDDAVFCNKCGRRQGIAPNTPAVGASTLLDSPLSQELVDSGQPPVGNTEMAQETPPVIEIPTVQRPSSSLNNPPAEQSILHRPFTPTAPKSKLQQNLGNIIAECAGILGLLAFFSLPYISLGIFGNLTGQQLASLSGSLSNQLGSYGFLWFEPGIAAVIVGIAGWQLIKTTFLENDESPSEKAAFGLIILPILSLIIIFFGGALQPNYPQYVDGVTLSSISTVLTLSLSFASGFWVYVVAMIVVLVGGIVQARSSW